MKKSNDNILNCLVMATIKQIIIILQMIILLQIAMNFKNCSNSDEQKSSDIKNNRGVSDVELEV